MSSGDFRWGPTVTVGAGFAAAVLTAFSGDFWQTVGFLAVSYVFIGVGIVVWNLSRNRTEIQKRAQQRWEGRETATTSGSKQNARSKKQRLIAELGAQNAAIVESVEAAVKRVVGSDAARAGWLGDVDFTADIAGITDSFRKAHELRNVTQQLAQLDKPSADDLKLLADARRTADDLVAAATTRSELIQKCASEAKLVDESLRKEQEDARTAQQRAELHAKLSSMLYGIEATPSASPANSAADSVMARVQAYREIKNQVQLARGE